MSSPTTYAFLTLSISIFIIVLPFTLISNRHETVWTISINQKSDVNKLSFGLEETAALPQSVKMIDPTF